VNTPASPPSSSELRFTTGLSIGIAALVFVTVFAVVTCLGIFFSWRQPKVFSATSRILVYQDAPDFVTTNTFMETQCEIIRSQRTLFPVIEQSKLTRRWEPEQPLPIEQVCARLKRNLQVQRRGNTQTIEITVTDQDPSLAAELANRIPQVFEYQWASDKRSVALRKLERLRSEAQAQETRVLHARTALAATDQAATNYQAAVGVHETEQRSLEALRQKIADITVEADVPQRPVQLIDRAQPATKPIRPSRLRGVAFAIAGGLMVALPLGCLTGLLLRRRTAKSMTSVGQPLVANS